MSMIQRPVLRLVEGGLDTTAEWVWFCGHCAAPSPGGTPPPPSARVCGECGLGLLLEARDDAVPTARDAFLVVDCALLVQAMSREAQALLGVTEELAINKQVAELLVPADAEAQGRGSFAATIAQAAEGQDSEPARAFVRPWNTFGVRMRARIATCGPPRAALIVLESGRPPSLRAVVTRDAAPSRASASASASGSRFRRS
jgi:PAS domain-containing protein